MSFYKEFTNTIKYLGVRPYLLSSLSSGIGNWIYIVTMTTLIYQNFGTFAVAIFGLLRQVPYIIFSALSGYLIDYYPRKSLLIFGEILNISLMLALAIFTYLDIKLLILYIIIINIIIIKVFVGTIDYPARLAIAPKLVDKSSLLTLNSLSNAIGTISLLVAPIFGSLIINSKGLEQTFLTNGLFFLAALLIILRLPKSMDSYKLSHKIDDKPKNPLHVMLRNWIEGFRFIIKQKKVLAANIYLFANHIVVGAVFVIIPFASDLTNQTSLGIGYLMSAFGLGNVIGTIAAIYFGKKKIITTVAVSVIGVGFSVILLGIIPNIIISYLTIILIGFFAMLGEAPLLTIIQEVTSDSNAGRVYAAVDALIIGSMGIGSLLVGWLLANQTFTYSLLIIGVVPLIIPLFFMHLFKEDSDLVPLVIKN